MLYPDLSGWCYDDELTELVRLAEGRSVLEIGTWCGRTAIPMAKVAQEVWCLDHFQGDKDTGFKDVLPEFRANCARHGVRDKMRLLVGDMHQILPLLNLSYIDMAYYDASHSFEDTRLLGLYLCDHLPAKAVIAFHDYNENHPDVVRAIDEVAEHHKHSRRFRKVGGVAILEPCWPPV